MTEATKQCGGKRGKVGPFCCGLAKPISEFGRHSGRADGLQVYCNECRSKQRRRPEEVSANRARMRARRKNPEHRSYQREWHLQRYYGITQDEYDCLSSLQSGRCAICRQTPGEAGQGEKRLCVDHCHKTGEIRALLCDRCNRALGMLDENPDRIVSTALYAVGWRARHRGASSEQIAAVRAGAAALKTAFKIWLAESLPDDVPIPDAAQPAA